MTHIKLVTACAIIAFISLILISGCTEQRAEPKSVDPSTATIALNNNYIITKTSDVLFYVTCYTPSSCIAGLNDIAEHNYTIQSIAPYDGEGYGRTGGYMVIVK